VAPFLAALTGALDAGGAGVLCHLPRAGVSHDVVAAALAAAPGLAFESRAVAADAAALAAYGDDCTAEDAANARIYDISRVDAAADDDDTVDAAAPRFAARVAHDADARVDLKHVQKHYRRFRPGLIYRASPTEVVVHFADEAALVRALADASPFAPGGALVATRDQP